LALPKKLSGSILNSDVRFAYSPTLAIKMSISYYSDEPALFYKSELISSTQLQSLQQWTRSQMVLQASFSEADSYVYKWVVDAINGDKARGTVSFDVVKEYFLTP
jgi:hypothetical protein